MFMLDVMGKNKDEKIINFSMRKARNQSWKAAKRLWSLDQKESQHAINKIDRLVVLLSKLISSPKSLMISLFLKVIQAFETKEVSLIISKLKAD
jgi:hypothetical protein